MSSTPIQWNDKTIKKVLVVQHHDDSCSPGRNNVLVELFSNEREWINNMKDSDLVKMMQHTGQSRWNNISCPVEHKFDIEQSARLYFQGIAEIKK